MEKLEKRKSGIKARLAIIATNMTRHGKDAVSEGHEHPEGAVLGSEAIKPKKSPTTGKQKKKTREERKKKIEDSVSKFQNGAEKDMGMQRTKPQRMISAMFKKSKKPIVKVESSAETKEPDDDNDTEESRTPHSAPIKAHGLRPPSMMHGFDDNATSGGETLSTSMSTFHNSSDTLQAIAEVPEETSRKQQDPSGEEAGKKLPRTSRRNKGAVTRTKSGDGVKRNKSGDEPKSPSRRRHRRVSNVADDTDTTTLGEAGEPRCPPKSPSTRSSRRSAPSTPLGEGAMTRTNSSRRTSRAVATAPTAAALDVPRRETSRGSSKRPSRGTGSARTNSGNSRRSNRSPTREGAADIPTSPKRNAAAAAIPNSSPRRSASFGRKRQVLVEHMKENEMKKIIAKILRKYPREKCLTFEDHHREALKVARGDFSQEGTAKQKEMESILVEKLKIHLSEAADKKHILDPPKEEDEDQSVSIATPQESPGKEKKKAVVFEQAIPNLSESELVHVEDLHISHSSGKLGKFTGTICKDSEKPQGKGRLEYPGTGQAYEGDWKQGFWSGYGKHEKANGDIYQGHFVDDIKHGIGVYRHADGKRVFEGRYVMGLRVDGSMNYADGSHYKGQWYSSKRHGRGVYRFSDGSTYTGEFHKDRIQGSGQLIWPDGGKYVGEWCQGNRHGAGKEFAADGSLRLEGVWRDGVPIDQ
jgi:hypothetical protein